MSMDKIKELDGIELSPHPSYNPDLAPSDYYLFRFMAHFLRGRKFKELKKAKGIFPPRIRRIGQTIGSNHRSLWSIFQILILCCINVL